MKKNKPDIPPEMRPQKDWEVSTSKFGFRKDMMIASYVPKQIKAVIMLSTMHSDASIDETTGDKQKPSVLTFYNSTKGGVDTADKKCAATSCSRRTNRWPMSLFYSLINKVCLNSFVIYVWNNETDGLRLRREFLRSLGKELLRKQLEIRFQNRIGIQRGLQNTIATCAASLGINVAMITEPDCSEESAPKRARRVRCAFCKDRKTNTYCSQCSKPVCKQHMGPPTCKNCIE